MKAIVHDGYGSPGVVEFMEISEPVAGEGEVLVRVYPAAVNPADWHIMRGLPYLARPVFGLARPRVSVRGTDVAGHVAAAGRARVRRCMSMHLGSAAQSCMSGVLHRHRGDHWAV